MAIRAIGSASSWKAAVSSRCRSSSVSMLFPSPSGYRPVPRRPGQLGPRATGPAHGGYGTSPCPPCTRAPPLSPPPTGPPRTAARPRPAAAAAVGGRHAAAVAGRSPQRRHRSPKAAPSGPERAFPHVGAAGPATDPGEQDSPAVSRRGLPGRSPAASCAEQGLLDQILGIVPVADQQESETEQLPAVPGHEGRELRFIPAGQRPARSSSPHTACNDARPRQVVSRRQKAKRDDLQCCMGIRGCGTRSQMKPPLDLPGKQPASRRCAAGQGTGEAQATRRIA